MVQRDWLVRSRDRWRSIASFWSRYEKTARSLHNYSLTGRRPYFFPFILLPFLFALLFLPSCLVKIHLNSLPSFLGRKYFKTIPNLSEPQILLTEPTYSLWISHQMILLALAQTWKNTWPFEYKYSVHNHKIHSLATTNYLTYPRRNSPTHSSHLNNQKISSLLFHQKARKSSEPENIQRFFRRQNCLSCKQPISRKYSKTFPATAISSSNQQQQPAAATRSSNQQQQPAAATSNSNQQQQPAAATSSSNQRAAISSSDQQQQPATAISSSNQQQQPAAATSSSNQQQQPAAATSSSNQQQQPAAATSSSNQQQQPAAATSSSNQQQQPAAATSSSNQRAAISSSDQQQQPATAININNQHSSYQQHLYDQRRHLLVITSVPSRGYPASSWPRTNCPVAECNHRTEAHFCYFSTFLKSSFCDFFPFLLRLGTDW